MIVGRKDHGCTMARNRRAEEYCDKNKEHLYRFACLNAVEQPSQLAGLIEMLWLQLNSQRGLKKRRSRQEATGVGDGACAAHGLAQATCMRDRPFVPNVETNRDIVSAEAAYLRGIDRLLALRLFADWISTSLQIFQECKDG